jgi:hypothetical protein
VRPGRGVLGRRRILRESVENRGTVVVLEDALDNTQ